MTNSVALTFVFEGFPVASPVSNDNAPVSLVVFDNHGSLALFIVK